MICMLTWVMARMMRCLSDKTVARHMGHALDSANEWRALAESVATASGPRLHGLSHLEADRTCDEEVVRTQAPPRNCARTDRHSEARMGCTGVACKQWATRHFECVAKWLHLHLLRS